MWQLERFFPLDPARLGLFSHGVQDGQVGLHEVAAESGLDERCPWHLLTFPSLP